jgi:hypothetical protein
MIGLGEEEEKRVREVISNKKDGYQFKLNFGEGKESVRVRG